MEALQRSVQYQQRTLLADVAQVSVVCVLRGVRKGVQATQDVTKQLTEKQHHAALTMDKLLQTSSELVQVGTQPPCAAVECWSIRCKASWQPRKTKLRSCRIRVVMCSSP